MEDTIEDTIHENNVKNNFFKLIKDKVEQYTVGDLKNDLFDAFIDGARFGDKTFVLFDENLDEKFDENTTKCDIMKDFVKMNIKNKWFSRIDYEEYNKNGIVIKPGMFYTKENDTGGILSKFSQSLGITDTREQIKKCRIFFNWK